MKKLILTYISLLFVLLTNQAYAQAITITSPNGGETLMVGTDYNISWSFMPTNPTQDVFTIELLLNNVPYSIIANNVAAANLPFIWRVPTTLPDRNDYRIRVSRTSNSSVNDISDANFGISGGRSIRINTPTNTTILNRGANFNITWIATFADNFKIDLLQNGTVLQNIVGATTGNLYTWSVPAMLPIGNNYQIRISSVTDATVFAESSVFAVEQTMRVNSPNGGQAYAKGSMQTITWVTSSNLTVAENVKIELTNNGVVIQTIAASIPNSGTHNWTVPNVTDGGNYKIRVSLLSNANVVDESDDTFAIGFFVRVTSPAKGEVWNRGSTYQIRWTTNVLALLRVELIVNGAVIRVVETGIPSTMVNNINWTVPNDLNNNDGYTIRVISLADANQQGSSEAFSIIAPPTIRVTSPQGGETWKKRETYDITWQSGASGNVKIDLLKNNVLAQVISNSTPNANGRFSWTIPANVLAGNDYRVRVNSLSINNLSGQSDANFTISEADSIRITNPVANANVIKGTDINITWTTNFAGNVVVELLRNATFYATISASTANNGQLTWKVPERVNDIPVESGAFYRIRIRTADNRISELSPLFSIADPTFQLSTPNGGEQFYKGFSYPIIWLSNIQGGVKIDLYNNNFTFIRTIAQEANGGRFDWVIPNDLIDGNFYSIRIISLTNATLIDDSGANFSILTGQIQVTNPRGGETWYGNGFTYPISWTNNTQRPVRVELWRGNALITNIANNVAANTTSFIIPNVPDGTDYRIRVSSIENTNLFVESNNIRILRPVLTLMSPRGGESFIQELTNRIEWTSNLPANELVKIDLYVGNVFNRVIASSVDNNNFHPWTIFTNVPLGTNYRIRVSLVNVPSIFSESPASFSIIRDNIPPVISDEVFPALFDGSNAAVSSIDPSFNVIDNLGTDGLRIICWYRSISNARSDMTGGWSQFNAVLEGNRYKGIIPKNAFDGEIGVEYYIEAIDRVGNVAQSPRNGRQNPQLAHIRYNNQNIPELIFGESVENYQIVAVPLDLNDKNAKNIFEDDLETYNDQQWRLLHYNNGELFEINNQERPLEQIEPGKGYWLIIKDKPINNIDVGEGTTVKVSSANPFSINLVPGWNQIGNPYNYNLSWRDILSANTTSGSVGNLKVYEESFKNTDVLKRYRGGFVFAASGGTLRIPTLKNRSINGRVEEYQEEKLENPISNPIWEVRLKASAGKVINQMAGFGMNPQAETLKDQFDDMTLPRIGKYIEVNFNRTAYFYPKFSKDIVPTENNFVWEFTIESNENEKITKLSWDNSYFGSDKQLILLDQELQRFVNMNSVNEYLFARTKDKYKFKVFFGDDKYIAENLQANKVVLDNYPNPFSNYTTLNFSLPIDLAHSHVSLKIYNSLGQEVTTLADKTFVGGFHHLTWEGRDTQNNVLPKGLYIVRLQITNTDKRISEVLHRNILIE